VPGEFHIKLVNDLLSFYGFLCEVHGFQLRVERLPILGNDPASKLLHTFKERHTRNMVCVTYSTAIVEYVQDS